MTTLECDVLVIGSGISGLSYALHLLSGDKALKIIIITKSDRDETNTKYAQGGIAVVLNVEDEESKIKHIEDTISVGGGLCKPDVVDFVISEGHKRFNELVSWGVNFDKNDVGGYDFNLEGGHTEKRVAHHKDTTGKEIERALLSYLRSEHYQVQILDYHMAIKLLYKESTHNPNGVSYCNGAHVLDIKNNVHKCIKSKATLISTGGIGQVYKNTTNPSIATGDGIALAKRFGLQVENMAFVQFHPTAFYEPNGGHLFLITEAVRGKGAKLINEQGERFMFNYDTRGELAPRDIVSRAIDLEIKKSNLPYVYLRISHMKKEILVKEFPNIYAYLATKQIFMEYDDIPVVPAVHYLCGGIQVNALGQTSVENLFSVGECTCTGLHGANRLASNSLLEAVVFSYRSAQKTLDVLSQLSQKLKRSSKQLTNLEEERLPMDSKTNNQILRIRKEVQHIMDLYVNVVRNCTYLNNANELLKSLAEEIDSIWHTMTTSANLIEVKNMLTVAILIVQDSLNQQENRGAFYNEDFVAKTII